MAQSRNIKGKTYSLIILRILEWDAHGRPSKCVLGYDDTTFRLDDPKQSNHFLTAFVDADMIKKATQH